MSRERPSWLVEPCPPWCHEDHADQDHPVDRYHQSRQILVPVVAPKRATVEDVSASSDRAVESDEMAVLALQPVGQTSHTWVAMVGEHRFLEVTLESAVRLHAALGEILDELR
ncbi:DUF6907 domain-containing protein [Microbacterium laevaniformans]|uniref:DUF6907 domain-containing protein n=1 Tax=Microbacterium laevaniformans TaxID=36807 RepID=UPI003640D001